MSKKDLSKRLWKDFIKESKKHNICSTEMRAFQSIPKNVVKKTLLSIGASLIGYWDSLVKDGWGSLNARALKSTLSEGVIVSGFKRTWIGPAPVGSNMKIVIKKRAGKGPLKTTAKGTITAEKYDDKGNIIERKTVVFEKSKKEVVKEILFSDEYFGFIIITVDTRDKAMKFPYAIKYKEVISRSETRRVKGFADIHVHLAAEYAYAGNWLCGNMMGAQETALKACTKKSHDGKLVNKEIKDLDEYPKNENELSGSYRAHGEGFPSFKDWPHHLDISHQQAHESWLKQAFDNGMRLIVASCVNSEVLALLLGALWDKDQFRDMNSMRTQIKMIHKFCERNNSWIEVAYNPWHARKIIHSNKMALVLAVECSNLFPKDGGHWEAQLEEMYCLGVRSFQIVHHCDNRWGGAAPQERGIVGIQTISRLTRSSLKDVRPSLKNDILKMQNMDFELDVNGESLRGISHEGEQLINKLMDMHLLIDTAHYSKRMFNDVYEIAQSRRYYPLYTSHTKFDDILSEDQLNVQREFLTTSDQIAKVNKTGGMLGLRTAPWTNSNSCCGLHASVKPDEENEIGTARNYAQQVSYAYQKNIPFAFGTDFNGFTNQLGPRNGEGKKPKGLSKEYWENGLHHIGMLPEVIKDLKVLKTPGASNFDQSAEAYLSMWERIWDPKRTIVKRVSRTTNKRTQSISRAKTTMVRRKR